MALYKQSYFPYYRFYVEYSYFVHQDRNLIEMKKSDIGLTH